ncbi:hypothetical protein ALO41_101729 [Pseudomonas amygdali pv. ulmi]|uniref:Uncharacterized protein n=1 Tax=Pseudomonas amygdali pv. ulmi TaxID=251720 RepID=A0A0Q0CQA0_PSEA0|nr:hypothetical protein ALO41_101729 [Pseudomonas amygdali pv. ulmi]RMR25648.1 hypothetical protein ALP90_101577 [Pseudomonas amygdali pv. ulmi]
MLDLPLCAHVCSLDSLGTSPPASAPLTERGAGKALKKGHRQIPCPARRILYAITADETPRRAHCSNELAKMAANRADGNHPLSITACSLFPKNLAAMLLGQGIP